MDEPGSNQQRVGDRGTCILQPDPLHTGHQPDPGLDPSVHKHGRFQRERRYSRHVETRHHTLAVHARSGARPPTGSSN